MNYESDLKKISQSSFDKIDELLNIPETIEKNKDNFETKIAKVFRELEFVLNATMHKLDDVVLVLEKNNIDTTEIFNR
ncbi:MAG: hypothetical protein ACYC0T_21735 [Ramlibacter sp.]